MIRVCIVVTVALICGSAFARALEGVSFDDKITVDGSPLVLNGVGLRVKRFALMNFKIYVAGLYAAVASKDPAVLLASDKPRRLRLVFVRKIERKILMEAWREGYDKNCGTDCDRGRESLAKFNDKMVDVKQGDEMIVDLSPAGVAVKIGGMGGGAKTVIADPLFARDLLNVFIGPNPATPELKKGLLGE